MMAFSNHPAPLRPLDSEPPLDFLRDQVPFPSSETMLMNYKMSPTGLELTPPSSTTRARESQLADSDDPIGMHLLVATALSDSAGYAVLAVEELEELKKEDEFLTSRIAALRRNLALETKVRDAAKSLNRLYTAKPSLTKVGRKSSSGEKEREGTKRDSSTRVESELAASSQRCEELARELYHLEGRSRETQLKLLKHTAGVLQMAHSPGLENDMKQIPGMHRPVSPASLFNDGYGKGDRGMDILLDDIRMDKAKSRTSIRSQGVALRSLTDRLQDMNYRTARLVAEVNPAKGTVLLGISEPASNSDSEDATATPQLANHQLDILTQALDALEIEQTHIMEERHELHNTVTDQMRSLNAQLSDMLEAASPEEMPPVPPEEQGPFHQINYTQQRLANLRTVLQSMSDAAETSRQSSIASRERTEEYESVLQGLWQIIIADEEEDRLWKKQAGLGAQGADDEQAAVEDFSVNAFSKKIQTLIGEADSKRALHGTLKRRITDQEQQLSRSVDPNSNPEILQMRADLDRATKLHLASESMLQEQERQLAERDEHIQRIHAEVDEAVEQTQESHRAEQSSLRAQITDLAEKAHKLQRDLHAASEAHSTAAEAHDKKSAALAKTTGEMQTLEAEVVRLTTELAMTKADLDAAYGSRSQRAAELQSASSAKLEESTRREAALKTELAGTLAEFEELTRGAVQAEREREALDSLVDRLRGQVENLETQLAEEKVNWMGVVRSNTQQGGVAGGGVPGTPGLLGQGTGTSVLRTEFKKLMRDTRTEHLKALRAEQEERRKLESQLRALRKGSGHVPSSLSRSTTS